MDIKKNNELMIESIKKNVGPSFANEFKNLLDNMHEFNTQEIVSMGIVPKNSDELDKNRIFYSFLVYWNIKDNNFNYKLSKRFDIFNFDNIHIDYQKEYKTFLKLSKKDKSIVILNENSKTLEAFTPFYVDTEKFKTEIKKQFDKENEELKKSKEKELER